MAQKIDKKRLIAYILVTIFALYYANICFFYHSHIINGITIVHSHIHSNAHAQTGTHSSSELALISILSTFHSLQAGLCFAGVGVFLFLQAIIRSFIEDGTVQQIAVRISARAPPHAV
jgi:ABC-type multidrug transport system fused ATPase/permease subunit